MDRGHGLGDPPGVGQLPVRLLKRLVLSLLKTRVSYLVCLKGQEGYAPRPFLLRHRLGPDRLLQPVPDTVAPAHPVLRGCDLCAAVGVKKRELNILSQKLLVFALAVNIQQQ